MVLNYQFSAVLNFSYVLSTFLQSSYSFDFSEPFKSFPQSFDPLLSSYFAFPSIYQLVIYVF